MSLWPLLVAFLVGAALVYSGVGFKKRQFAREVEEYIHKGRYVDIGVELRTVVQDPNGEELIRAKPRLRIVETRRFGGVLDRRTKRIVGPSRSPHVWYASPEQTRIILHADDDPLGQLIYGSEGGGKTEALVRWHYLRWLENLGENREGGQVAPTQARLEVFLDAFRAAYPPAWYHYAKSKRVIFLADGSRIRLVSTHRQSEDQGSPIQGFGWSWAGADEAQDSIGRWDDIESRGRSARVIDGVAIYKQARTATAKDNTEWRDAKDVLLSSERAGRPLWVQRKLLGKDSPFVAPSFWADKKATMSSREYQRRVLAMDVGPELAVYYGWQRDRNLVAYPQIAADVTPAVLANYRSATRPGAAMNMLGGHDPGVIYNTSVLLRLLMFGDTPTWVVVGELQTKQTTEREHALELKKLLQGRFQMDAEPTRLDPHPRGGKTAIFVDPHGKSEGQSDYQTHYMPFQTAGLDTFNPTPMIGRIKRTARVEMLNRLLEQGRLVIACDERKQSVAPVLVRALESLQKRPGEDNPDGERRKDESDQTHAPAALAYALWPFEQEAFTGNTVQTAIAAARGRR